ncbi:MAG: hypothetical protein GY941_00295 [Planctomycetes bacterium]|nr:hypothetical protein [Planctomycetota bacterium]
MNTRTTDLTPEQFHELLHKDINKAVRNFRDKWIPPGRTYIKVHNGAHRASWATATIHTQHKLVNVQVYLNFKKNNLSDSDYIKLKQLVCDGIRKYWSRHITLSGHTYIVRVQANHRNANAIPVDLYIETDKNKYARSMNPATLGIDASFIYNKGRLGNLGKADADFKLVAAHEFGHSVLMYAGGFPLSWGHKGSTNPLTQSVKSTTPGYPKSGPIDLMKYYDPNKASIFFSRRISDSIAMEVDVKRLIWGANIQWVK